MPDWTVGSQGVGDYLERYNQLHANAKIADSMVKANPDFAARMGFASPQQFYSLSAQDKIAATTGYIKQQGVQEAIARMKEFEVQTAERAQQMQDEQAVGTFLQNWGKAAPELKPEEKLSYALTNTPGISGRNFPRAIESLARYQQLTATDKGYGTPGTVTDIPGMPGRKFVWQTEKSGTAIEDGSTGSLIPPKPTVPAEPGFAWRWTGKDWQMAQLQPGNLPPATASKLDSLTAQEQSILTEMSTPYKPGWFDEKPEARTKRLEAALANIRARKALLLDPRGSGTETTPAAPATTRRYNPETGLIE